MIIKTIAFGNWEEAFIETRLKNQVNVIFSDDNNRGKTLVIQSLMYALGNSPIFPSTFDEDNHYYYVEAETRGRCIEVIRRRNNFSVLQENEIHVFDNVSDFKHFFDQFIFRLPRYSIQGTQSVSDLSLFFQLFFLPQDKRNTSNTINHGYTNKDDFLEMVMSMGTPLNIDQGIEDTKSLKKDIDNISRQISRLERRNLFSRQNPDLAIRVQSGYSNSKFKKFEQQVREINKQISTVSNRRNRELNRKIKLDNLVNELRSLNQNIEIGRVKCGDCGSEKIVYTSGDLVFEITNDLVRKQILSSIASQITQRSEIISSLSDELGVLQRKNQEILLEIPTEVADMIIFKDQIADESKNDEEIAALQARIADLKKQLSIAESAVNLTNALRRKVIDNIVIAARKNYKDIDPTSDVKLESLFTKFNETYSGSEGQIFYYAKLKAISEILKLPFPIIVDSFREGEISTEKESKMLDGYVSLKKQVIVTSTLKNQEYYENKYSDLYFINPIDYSHISANKILSTSYKAEFQKLLRKFNLTSN